MDLTMGVLYPSAYLKADDLRGKPVTVTITSVAVSDVIMTGGKKEKKVVCSLAKTTKLWIAGKTNGFSLAVLLGSDGHHWTGKRVTLIADVDKLGRDQVPCIRVHGSPDATEVRARAYAGAWRGVRERGALVARLKVALALLDLDRSALPPIEAAQPVDCPDMDSPADDDMFADPPVDSAETQPAPMREPGDDQ